MFSIRWCTAQQGQTHPTATVKRLALLCNKQWARWADTVPYSNREGHEVTTVNSQGQKNQILSSAKYKERACTYEP